VCFQQWWSGVVVSESLQIKSDIFRASKSHRRCFTADPALTPASLRRSLQKLL
jgi:hypothetical protein